MMRTKTWQDLLRSIENVIPRSVFEQLAFDILNASVGRLWDAFPWRQSIGVIPPFYLLPETAEYPDVLSDMPSDMSSVISAYVVDVSNPSSPIRYPLQPVREVERARIYGMPQFIARREFWRPLLDYPLASYVLFPIPSSGMGAPNHLVTGTYKRCSPVVGPATISSLLPFSDSYFADLVSIARYTAWEFAGDPRARDKEVLSALSAIYSSVAAREGFQVGPQTITPAESLFNLDLR